MRLLVFVGYSLCWIAVGVLSFSALSQRDRTI